jgi:hypothetical protein
VRHRAVGERREEAHEIGRAWATTSASTSMRPSTRAPQAIRPPRQPIRIRPSRVVRV